jgi:4'-phosphopantetheinyl transferase
VVPYTPGDPRLTLDRGSIDVWLAFDARFADAQVAEFAARLAPQESARMNRLRLPVMQRQFAITRALQRYALSAYQPDIQPSEWQFQLSAEGRPSLAPPFEHTGLHFNISHTEGLVVMAICRHVVVGVDVEKSGRVSLDVAEQYFSAAEAAQLFALPAHMQPRRFLQLWTLKEAYLKAVGTGLAGGLGRMSFVFESPGDFRFERAEDPDAARWQFRQYAIGAHLLGLAALPDAADLRLALTWRELCARSVASGQEQRAQS